MIENVDLYALMGAQKIRSDELRVSVDGAPKHLAGAFLSALRSSEEAVECLEGYLSGQKDMKTVISALEATRDVQAKLIERLLKEAL